VIEDGATVNVVTEGVRQWRLRWPLWRPSDPGLVALRRAARAALVIPLAFLFGHLATGDLQFQIFIVFGCFALLVMADFGGPGRGRALAYVGATVAGGALVALGTLVSATAAGGAAVMLVVGFALVFAAILGGYLMAAQTGLLLAFVISVSLPAPASALPARVGGWMLAGLLSTIAAAVLWPRPERADLPNRAAAAVLAVVEVLQSPRHGPGLAGRVDEARKAVRASRLEYTAAARRPAGLKRKDRAYVELFMELDRIADVVERPFQSGEARTRACVEESDRLATSVLDALRASAAVLAGGAAPDLGAVDQARRVHREALNRWAAEQLQAGRPAEEVLDAIDADHTLRVISYLAIGLAGNARAAAGERLETAIPLPASIPRRTGVGGVAVRFARIVRTHLEPRSPVLHNSLRVGIGLALSVLLARSLSLSHAFWVVLGTLQVLRTSALGTGRTTVQALAGNVVGFVVGGLFAVLVGNNSLLMWGALPFTVFLAAYATTTAGFVISQAAFTVNLIILFNLISPSGWQVGLVRIEDVAAGAAVSVVVGVLLWPRGARQELARSASTFYRETGAYLEWAFNRVLGSDASGDADPLRRQAVRARDRASEALDSLLAERGAKHLEPQTAAVIVAAGNQGMLAGDALTVISTELGYRAGGCPDGAAALRIQVGALLARFLRVADDLEQERHGTGSTEPVSTDALRAAALACLRRWGDDPAAGRAALAVVMAAEWAQNLARLEEDVEQPVSAAVDAARIPWWR
jgi:uncharacterized membrane protein YccC